MMNKGWTIADIRQRAFIDGDCWIWNRNVNGKGYGQLKIEGRYVGAHRLAFAIREGIDVFTIDSSTYVRHDCDEPMCVNPAHLQSGDAWDNFHDSRKRGRRPMKKTHCVHGHEYDAKNTYVDRRGRRHCRECERIRSLKKRPATKRGRYRTKNNPLGDEIRGT